MSTTRNPSLDGLRGLAVILVLLYHHGVLNMGWAGVDLFFVLSGFLITRILRDARTKDHYWRTYWTKRALRILPPLLIVLALTAVLRFSLSLREAGIYLISGGDLLAWLHPHFEPLRPLWSLAVEEHFYLLWPMAVRRWPRRALVQTLLALIVAEPILRAIASAGTHGWELVYFLTPFRLDGLAMGCVLALAIERAERVVQIRRWCAPAGALLASCWLLLRVVLGRGFTRDNPTMIYNALCYSLVAAISACVVAHLLLARESRLSRLLAMPWLAWLGTISYGLYLYQVPIREAVIRSQVLAPNMILLFTAPCTLMFAVISYYGIERPLMRAVIRPRARQTLSAPLPEMPQPGL